MFVKVISAGPRAFGWRLVPAMLGGVVVRSGACAVSFARVSCSFLLAASDGPCPVNLQHSQDQVASGSRPVKNHDCAPSNRLKVSRLPLAPSPWLPGDIIVPLLAGRATVRMSLMSRDGPGHQAITFEEPRSLARDDLNKRRPQRGRLGT